MGQVSSPALVPAIEIDGHKCPPADKNVQRRKFGRVVKLLWDGADEKADAELAVIGNVDTRTVRRWMQGKGEPPWPVLKAIIDKMLEPER